MKWADLLDEWALLEHAWLATYGERLRRIWPALSWRDFLTGVRGLLSDDNALSRALRDQPETEVTPDG